jgi:acyl-[acyl-carrier-protein]-phospholipid O-acyltransferase/long-chain-fatty-acid--[acyl-carrier-protein] ligase
LIVSQALGAFNDNAWKQLVVLLAFTRTTSDSAAQGSAAMAQVILLIPLILFNLPGGVLADRLSKRLVILGTKCLELGLILLGTLALVLRPAGGPALLVILGLLGVQAALFGPSKYGILPEILPHEKLSRGNGLLEMWANLAIIGGTVAGGVLVSATGGAPWVGGLFLTLLAAGGLLAALTIPRVSAARSEGGLTQTLVLGWRSIRSDRILRLAVVGQVFVWSIASLVPAPVLAFGARSLGLPEWAMGFPLAAIGVGIGLGSILAGRLSGPKVEYGLLPLGAMGLTLSALAFGLLAPHLVGGATSWDDAAAPLPLRALGVLTQPGFVATVILMNLLGISAGLLFVPLNAMIQWRAPHDRRGAVIALGNMMANGGMLAGSLVAMGLAAMGVAPSGTFLGASIVLALGTAWALWLVPDSFMRFVLLLLAVTLYRLRVIGRGNLPAAGPALLTPNHVSFADGLFMIASVDRPIRFVVYADYFQRPLIGAILRTMKAIPIAATGGPRMILEAFREAGRALDNGELVCIFPEGQITRTGTTLPFQRGMERILKGRAVPVIPVQIDRATSSIFSPIHRRRWPERIPLPVTVSFGPPLPAQTPPFLVRQVIMELGEEAWLHRKVDRRPLHRQFIRQARRHPGRLAFVDGLTRPQSFFKALTRVIALSRVLGPRWRGQPHVGVLLPTSVAGILVNLSAALAGRTVVNLNFTAGKAAMQSAARQSNLRTLVTSRAFHEKARLELPETLEIIWIEDLGSSIGFMDRVAAFALALLAPVRLLERLAGVERKTSVDDPIAIIFSSGSEGDPKGVVLSHFNIDANIEAIGQIFDHGPEDRILDVLPLFHSFGYLLLWLGACRGVSLVCHPNPLEAGAVGGLSEKYRATILFATPTFLNLYSRRCAPAQFGSIRLVIAGAEKLPESIGRHFEETFGVRPLEGYGMTECSPVVAVNAPDFRAAGFFQPGSRRGYVGHPLPGVAIRVVDPSTIGSQTVGDPLPAETEGMVLVKGPNVMQGYLGRDDLTQAAMRDGWYVTGDLGMLDADGFVRITGRLSRFSKIGGEMVPHGVVEDALNEAIGASEPAFAVTAVPDSRNGEQLAVLHTVGEEQVDDALARMRGKGLPNLFLPRRDHFLRVESLPWLGTGKLDLRALKRIAVERFQAESRDASAVSAAAR